MKNQINLALSILGIRPFRCESCDDTWNAQRNLQGRTHYVDPDTLRGFKARITYSDDRADGLLFVLVESVGSKPYETSKNKRFVVFDVFGSVVNDRDQWHRTTEQACKSMADFLAGFDAEAHTAQEIVNRCNREIEHAQQALSSLAEQS